MELEGCLGQGMSLREIGRHVGLDESTVGYWVKKYKLRAVHADRHASRGGVDRERLESLVTQGLSIRRIAAEVGLSAGAVRHWLRRVVRSG